MNRDELEGKAEAAKGKIKQAAGDLIDDDRLRSEGLPLAAANLSSIWTICYLQPSRYNWMLQYYLRAEGLAPAEIAQALTHLDSPALTPTERSLLGFARETVWYQPAQIQRRARSLRSKLSDEELTEAIGVLSFANALCRLASAVVSA